MAVDKLVDSAQLNADLTRVANAIRTKGGTSASMAFPAGFVDAIGDIPTEGGYTIDQISTVGFPALPDNIVFNGTRLRTHLFRGSRIKTFSAPNLIDVSGYPWGAGSTVRTFENCEELLSVSMPSLQSFLNSDSIFSGCTKMTNIVFDWKSCTGLASDLFNGCESLELPTIVMPNLASNIWSNCFRRVKKLKNVDAYNKNVNQSYEFRSVSFIDSGLELLILRNAKMNPLLNINAFSGTPFAVNGAGGKLYVPQDLLSTYQTATNWSTIIGYANNQILPIEGSIYETQYADGTPIT